MAAFNDFLPFAEFDDAPPEDPFKSANALNAFDSAALTCAVDEDLDEHPIIIVDNIKIKISFFMAFSFGKFFIFFMNNLLKYFYYKDI